CILYPFLPGGYDPLAVPLSAIARLFGAAGLLLVPIGVLWLIYELRGRGQRKDSLPNSANGRYCFAIVSLIVVSILAIAVSLLSLFGISISIGILTLTLWLYVIARLIPRLKPLKDAENESLNPVPLYLIVIPSVVLLFQVTLAAPATEF